MDIYGNTSGIGSGGEIFGDIDIDGELKANTGEFDNLNVIDTLTTDVLISRESVETKDTLLHLGVDNVADTANLGTFWEYQDGVKKYGGLVRNKTTKRIRAFQNNTTQPTPTSDVSTFPLADLECNQIKAGSIELAPWTGTGNGADLTWASASGRGEVEFVDFGGTNHGVCIRSANDNPSGAGVRTFRSRGTLAAPSALLSDDAIDERAAVLYDGTAYVASGRFRWRTIGNSTPSNHGTYCELLTVAQNTILEDRVIRFDNTGITIGTGGTDYKLPITRGTVDQILKTDGSGGVSWVNDVRYITSPSYGITEVQGDLNLIALSGGAAQESDTANGGYMTVTSNETWGFTFTLTEDTEITDVSININLIGISGGKRVFNIYRDSDQVVLFSDNVGVGEPVVNFRYKKALINTLVLPAGAYRVGVQLVNNDSRGFTDQSATLNPNLGVVRGCTIAGFNYPSTLLGIGFVGAGNIYFRQPPTKNGKLTASGGLGIGVSPTDYTLPSTRGTDGQVLKTNATGVVSWSAPPNPFNQDLNTGDVPRFVGVSSENFYASLNGVDGVNMVAETFFGPGSERIKFRHNLVATTTDLMLLSTTEVKVEVPLVTNSITCTDFICNSNLNISQFEIGDGFLFMDRSDNTIGGAGYITKKSRGTRSAPLAVSSGDTLNALIAKGYDGSAYVESASLQYKCSENWSVGNNGSNLIFDITPKTTTGRIPWFTISDDYFELGNKNAGTSYKLPVARGTFNQILQTDGLGNTAWVSRPIGEAGFINNATETTFVSANEWKICAGTYIQGTIADFSLQTNRLRYDGTLTQNFRILGSASVEKNLTGSAICRISIFTNGVDNTRSHQVQAINATANFPQHLSANAIIVLAPGDLVDIRVQNNTDDENFTVLNLQMIITEV